MIRRPPRSTQSRSSAASDVYKRQALANKSTRSLLPTTGNLGRTDGAWFVFVNAVNSRPADPANESVVVTVGRALGATHSAIDNGSGGHDLKPGDPWYLKRFFVDGHEYNVVALHIVPATYRLSLIHI